MECHVGGSTLTASEIDCWTSLSFETTITADGNEPVGENRMEPFVRGGIPIIQRQVFNIHPLLITGDDDKEENHLKERNNINIG